MKKYIAFLMLLFSPMLFSVAQSPPKATTVFEANFKYFVHGVAVDTTLEKWEVKHTGAISKTIILTTQTLSIKDDGDVRRTVPITHLKRFGTDWVWFVEEHGRRLEVWHWNPKDKLLRLGFQTNHGNFHQIRYYRKARSIPLNSKFS